MENNSGIAFREILPWLEKFVHLTELVIISQSIHRITNLKGCPNLRRLWICECELDKIENIDCCRMLEELYLYGNNISSIENLEKLENLSVLWLNDNQISSIEGVSKLLNLSVLNLSDNLIKVIGKCLEQTIKLTCLHISGNIISDFDEIVALSHLPQLSSLSINECGFKQNPICTNPNLPLVLMYYLPKLRVLDNVSLDMPELRHSVRAVMNAKQGFYANKGQHILSIQDSRQNQLKERYKCIESKILSQIQQLDKTMRHLQFRKGFKIRGEQNTDTGDSLQISQYINELQTRITFWEYMIEKYEEELQFASYILKQHTDLKYNLLQLELELCGYFEFMEGSTSDEWFHRCSKLVASRFCLHHLYAIPVSGIRVHNVYKVNNKLLLQKFENWIKKHTEFDELISPRTEEIPLDSDLFRSYQDYLLVVCPKNKDKTKYFPELLKSGIKIPNQGAPLSNSLSIADEENLGDLLRSCSTNKHWTPARFTTILLIRANTKYGLELLTKTNADDDKEVLLLKNPKKFNCTGKGCSCRFVNKSFSFSEENCLLPEFIVELEYLTKHEVVSPFYQILVSSSSKLDLPLLEEDIKTDSTLLKKIPHRFLRPTAVELSENTLDLFYDNKANSESVSLNVNDVKCPRTLNLQRFKDLTHLRLNHCYLQKMPLFTGQNLVLVDLSYNRIGSLRLLPNLQKLLSFDIRHNSLSNALEDLDSIQASFPKLREMQWRFNPWKRKENLRYIAAAMLPGVEKLDSKDITEAERSEGKRLLSLTKIDNNLMQSERVASSTPGKDYPFLSIDSVAKQIVNWSMTIPRVTVRNTWSSIISLCLENCNLRKLENMERLINLKFLNVDYNHLKSLRGVFQCINIEELSAENNFISMIDELENLKKLRRLLLGNNAIKSLTNIPDGSILQLKSLANLTVIDLHGNPITQKLENYRFRIIHHLKGLKSLDGNEVRMTEVMQSKELLGGHLSNEFIMEKLETDQFTNLTQMDMPNMGLKIVDYLSSESFRRLQSVNLEKNQLTSFGGLLFLPELRVLCLNENCIESLFPKHISLLAESVHSIFPHLQVVHLAKNQICSLEPFHFHRMPALRSLFLQHNEIVNITGLEGLHQLRELVLDGNRIKEIGEVSFFYNWSLQEIHLENNRLKELQSLCGLESLKRLYVGGNKLCNLGDLETFAIAQKNLIEISVVDNPITAKQLHRLILVHGSPRLQSIDGIPVTAEEKDRASAFYYSDLIGVRTPNLIQPLASEIGL
ncbi:unnamed protein product [Echinostoma caproni]|uniref:Leucine-rich repeat-containing protein 9 n=1 Tax=Echinostoma caproni TaxID=27848 RepID=A0A183AQI2_9TREM|nr:unnamed protein product [Echinostoma caproni]